MKLGIRNKHTLLLGTLVAAALLLSACTAKVIPIPVPVPITAAGGTETAAVSEAIPAESGALALEGVTWQVTELRGYDLSSGRRLRFSAFIEDSQPRRSPTGDRWSLPLTARATGAGASTLRPPPTRSGPPTWCTTS